jgi:O-antigen ligase
MPLAALEAGLAVGGCALLAVIIYKYGPSAAAAVLVAAAVFVAAVASPKILACTIVVLMPFSSVQAAVGVHLPAGLDPIDLLVVLAVLIGAGSLADGARRDKTVLGALIGLNVGLLVIAWWRTYGHGSISVSSTALVIKPAIEIAAGFLAIRLIPPAERMRTLGTIMAIMLFAVGGSVFLQRLGLYHTSFEASHELNIKKYGGILLDGNDAGAFLAMFSVPTYLILRATGRGRWGFAILALAFPVLLITLARGAMVAFALTLVFLAILDGRRAETLLVLCVVVALGVAWATTGGQSQVQSIEQRLAQEQFDPNAQLSGRLSIWQQAFQFLNEDKQRWVIGGGLNSFKSFAGTTTLQGDFATHNALLAYLTDGGVFMAAAFYLLLLWLLLGRLRIRADPVLRSALRIAVISYVVVGATAVMTITNPTGSWIWLLAAAVLASATAGSDAATADRNGRLSTHRDGEPAPSSGRPASLRPDAAGMDVALPGRRS